MLLRAFLPRCLSENRSEKTVVLALALCLPASGFAATAINWADSPTNTAFSSGASWSGGTAPADDLTTNTAVFTSVANAQPTLDVAARSIAGLDFQLASGGGVFTSIAGATLTIGASGLGATTQVSGTTAVSVETLKLSATQVWNFFANGASAATINLSSNINLNGANLTIASNRNSSGGNGQVNLSGAISGTGGLLLQGGSAQRNFFSLTGSSSYVGSTTIRAAVATANSLANTGVNSALGSSGDIIIANDGSFASLVFQGMSANGATDRALKVNGSSPSNSLVNNDTTYSLSFTNTGNVAGGTAAALTFNLGGTNAGANTFSGTINDRGTGANITSLKKNDAGTWILNGSSTYTGATTISAGTLAAVTSHAFGDTSAIAIAGSGTLSLRGDADTTFAKTGGGAYTIAPSATGATVNVDQASVAGTAAKTMSIGALSPSSTTATFGVTFTGANNTSLAIASFTGPASSAVATVTLTNSITGGGSLQLGSYTSANTAGGESLSFSGNGNTTVTGAINPSASTALAVAKNGAGTLTLGASNGFAGSLTINAGTVIAGDANALSSAAASTITVKSTASLVVGLASAMTGQTVNVASSVALNSGGSLVFDIFADSHNTGSTRSNTSDNDCVLLTGAAPTVNLSGTLKVLNPNGMNGGSFTVGDRFWLLNWNSVSTTPAFSGAPTFDLSSFTSSGVTFDTSQFLTSGFIQVASVPEPKRVLLGVCGLSLLFLKRRRRVPSIGRTR